MPTTERMRDDAAIDDALDGRARLMIRIASTCPHLYAKDGRALTFDLAFQREALVSDLLKTGLFAMNLHRHVSAGREGRSLGVGGMPSFLVASGLHYAIVAAPLEAGSAPGRPVVDVDALSRQVDRVERTFGTIPVDHALAARMSGFARARAARPGASREMIG